MCVCVCVCVFRGASAAHRGAETAKGLREDAEEAEQRPEGPAQETPQEGTVSCVPGSQSRAGACVALSISGYFLFFLNG